MTLKSITNHVVVDGIMVNLSGDDAIEMRRCDNNNLVTGSSSGYGWGVARAFPSTLELAVSIRWSCFSV